MTDSGKYHLSISGLVGKPAFYSETDLGNFRTIDTRILETSLYGTSTRVLTCRGIPLRPLLEMARVKSADVPLSVMVRNAAGARVSLRLEDVLGLDHSVYTIVTDARYACVDGGIPGDGPGFPWLVMAGEGGGTVLLDGIMSVTVTTEDGPDTSGELLVIGVGPGDATLLTLQSISVMAMADSFVASPDIVERFGEYLAGRPVLCDPLECTARYVAKRNPGGTPAAIDDIVRANRLRQGAMIAGELEAGRRVAVLDYGDPTIYGSWSYWLPDAIPEERIRVFPAISSLNAANSMIGRNIMYGGSAVITTPEGIGSNPGLIEKAASHGDTVVIFLGLHDVDRLMPLLERHYPPDTPVAVAYRAGYLGREYLLRADMGSIVERLKEHHETHLALIYIGPWIENKGDLPGD